MNREEVVAWLRQAAHAHGVERRNGAIVIPDLDIPPQACAAISAHLSSGNIRPISHQQVTSHVEDMRDGNFSVCYDPIIFNSEWLLTNGQHRVTAGGRSGLGLQGVVVIAGSRECDRNSIDAGRKRTIRQTHGIPGDVAACVTVVLCLEANKARAWTRARVADRYSDDEEVFNHYVALFRARPILKESHVSASFAFAELYRPMDAGLIRELAEDLATGPQEDESSQLIASHVTRRRSAGVRVNSQKERMTESLMFLRAIQARLCGASIAALGQPTQIAWWLERGGADANRI